MTNPWEDFDLPPAAVEVWRMEATCRRLRAYEQMFVPALLQTPAYTRALLEALNAPPLARDVAEAIVGARSARQGLLSRPNRPDLQFLVEEAALRRLVGSRAVMRGQLDRIEEVAAAGVSVQVVPAGSPAHPGMFGAFTVFDDQVFREQGPDGPDHFGPAGGWPAVFERIAAMASRAEDTAPVLASIRRDLTPST